MDGWMDGELWLCLQQVTTVRPGMTQNQSLSNDQTHRNFGNVTIKKITLREKGQNPKLGEDIYIV